MSDAHPLHVCVVAACPFPEPRGTPVRIQRLSEAVARLGHRVSVLTYHLGSADAPALLELHRIRDVPSYTKTGPGPSLGKLTKLDPMLVRRLRGFLRENRVDVIHAHHYEGLLVALAGSRGSALPVVYDAHTMLSTELPEYGFALPRSLLRVLGRFLDRRIPKRADHVIAVTDSMKAKLEALGVASDRVTVISQGIEEEAFRSGSNGGGAVEGRGARSATVVFAGNLASYQGIDSLLEAIAIARRSRPDLRLRILSDSSFDPYEARSMALGIREAIDIEAVAVSALPAALREAAVTVNPRVDCDGIPIKLLNYMAAGRPIVSYGGSYPIRSEEPTAFLVRDGDVDAFAAAIVSLLEDPAAAEALGRAGRRYAEAHHDWARIAECTERIYRRVIAARRGDASGRQSTGGEGT